jgi:hypothetical protein
MFGKYAGFDILRMILSMRGKLVLRSLWLRKGEGFPSFSPDGEFPWFFASFPPPHPGSGMQSGKTIGERAVKYFHAMIYSLLGNNLRNTKGEPLS